jgi:hypothetical protein
MQRLDQQEAAQQGGPEPKVNELDVWALVVRAGVRNTADDRTAHLQLAAYSKAHCGQSMVAYLFRHRAQLPTLIDDVWQWECVSDILATARRSRVESLRVASASACACDGRWLAFVVSSFVQNGINIGELCNDVLRALSSGRSETMPVIVLAGRHGGEGKSVFFKTLFSVFAGDGLVFPTPEKGNFPLLGLESAKVAFLDEWRFDPFIVSYATQCLWFDGSAVPIARPQNVAGSSGHMLYKGTAPIFITTKLADLEWLEKAGAVDPSTGVPNNADASMVLRRLKVYRFTVRVQKPSGTFPFCARCFATLVHTQAAAWAANSQ